MKTQTIIVGKTPQFLLLIWIAGIALILLCVDTIVTLAGIAGWNQT